MNSREVRAIPVAEPTLRVSRDLIDNAGHVRVSEFEKHREGMVDVWLCRACGELFADHDWVEEHLLAHARKHVYGLVRSAEKLHCVAEESDRATLEVEEGKRASVTVNC